jgi:hypothetical protein
MGVKAHMDPCFTLISGCLIDTHPQLLTCLLIMTLFRSTQQFNNNCCPLFRSICEQVQAVYNIINIRSVIQIAYIRRKNDTGRLTLTGP